MERKVSEYFKSARFFELNKKAYLSMLPSKGTSVDAVEHKRIFIALNRNELVKSTKRKMRKNKKLPSTECRCLVA